MNLNHSSTGAGTLLAAPRMNWRHFLLGLAGVQAVNLACALAITKLALTGSGFLVNLVFSICIGTLAYTFINGGRMLIWGAANKPPVSHFLALMLAGLVCAQFLGSLLAGWLTGLDEPGRKISSGTTEILVLSLLVGMAASWVFWNRGKLAWLQAEAEAEKARAAAIERQALQAQLQLLQAQIEPHMLFNTLANLQGLIALDPARAQELLDQLIQYLRATLSSSRVNSTTVACEFDLVRAYLGLMQVRMGGRLHCVIELAEDAAGLTIAPMLLQPLVENALKHGLEPRIEGGTIRVSASCESGRLVLRVRDDGVGPGGAAGTAGTGLGLANIRERIAGLYGPSAELALTPAQPGTLATLSLPLP